MANRKFDSRRAYKLMSRLAMVITIFSAFFGLHAYYQLYSDSVLHTWENYCSNPSSPEYGLSCMSVGFSEINSISNFMDHSLTIAIFLPIFFFGGTALYNYLFPEDQKN